jgi:hypothetical protein
MKPMTDEEIDHLKIWAEKQQQRRPNEILYQDLLRLIDTIAFKDDAIEDLRPKTKEQTIEFVNRKNLESEINQKVIKQIIEQAMEAAYKQCAELAEKCQTGTGAAFEIRRTVPNTNLSQNSSQSQPEPKEAPSPEIGERSGTPRIISGPYLNWTQDSHPFVGMHPGAPCKTCGLPCADPVHDLPVAGRREPEEPESPVIAQLDPDSTSLKSALEAIRDRVSPDQQYLIDELIKGERS